MSRQQKTFDEIWAKKLREEPLQGNETYNIPPLKTRLATREKEAKMAQEMTIARTRGNKIYRELWLAENTVDASTQTTP